MNQYISIKLLTIILSLSASTAYCNQSNCFTDSISSKISIHNNIDFEEALDSIDLDLEYLFNKFDTSCVVSLYRNYINSTNGKSAIYHLVFDDLWDALLLADQADLKHAKSGIQLDLARFFGYLGKYDEAEEYFDFALNIFKELDFDPERMNYYYTSKAQFYNEKGNQEKAKLYVDSCYQIRNEYNLTYNTFFIKYREGAILRDEGNHVEAIKIFKEVIENFKLNYPPVNGIVYHNLGKSYAAMGRYNDAIECYNLSIETINKYESHLDQLPEVHELLADAYHKVGDNNKAYKYSKITNALKEEYGNPNYGMNNHLMQVKDDFKEFKISERNQKRKRELESLSQDKKLLRLQRILLAGLMLFLIMIALVYFYMQRVKLKTEQLYNKTLSSRNEEINSLFKNLEKKNEEQAVFSNIMTHDLKAPLRTINSFASLLKRNLEKENFDKQKSLKFNDYVLESSTLMIKLIEDLLFYFKVGVDERKFESTDLNALLEETFKSFSFDLKSKDITLNIDSLPLIMGSEELLKTVFHNLISNGIKYQPLNNKEHIPEIHIYAKSDATNHFIYFVDNGIGIDEKFKKQIFDSFSKYHNRSEYTGSGLGLHISKEIMHKHNGVIELVSSKERETIFKLTFPKLEV